MLPILMYNNMEGGSNSLNNTPNTSFNQYDDSIILNCVRNRKKVTELPSCPVCSCTIRHGELDSHLALEVDRLQKLSGSGSKRKLSANSSVNLAVPGSSTSVDVPEEDVDVSGCLGSDVYQRIHSNRLRRLRARRRSTPPPQHGECPVCNTTLPVSRLQRHALRCLKRTGAELDEDVPDTSSEDGSIDVENDEPAAGGFGAEYQWCGEWRVRATALQDSEARDATCVRRASNDQALVLVALSFYATGSYQRLVGGTQGTMMSQQSVSRAIRDVTNALNSNSILNKWLKFPPTRQQRDLIKQRFYEKFKIPAVTGCIDGTHVAIVRPSENEERFYNRKGYHSRNVLIVVDGDEDAELYGPPQYSPSRIAPDAELTPADAHTDAQTDSQEAHEQNSGSEKIAPISSSKCNGLVEASAETRIQALKARIKDLERKTNGAGEMKCLICLEQYTSPTVSIQCWHVYCEVCWLQSLRAKKICPQCNAITTAQHLRRIYM